MSGYYLFFEAILRRFKALLLLAVLMGLGVGAVGYFAGSNNSARDAQRILWARTYVQEIVEGGSSQWLTVDGFSSLFVGPNPEPDVWNVSGRVVTKNSAGEFANQRFVVAVRNLCRPYEDRKCWQLAGLTLGEQEIPIEKLGVIPNDALGAATAKLFDVPSVRSEEQAQAQPAAAQATAVRQAKFPAIGDIEAEPPGERPLGAPVVEARAGLVEAPAVAMLPTAAVHPVARSRIEAIAAVVPGELPATVIKPTPVPAAGPDIDPPAGDMAKPAPQVAARTSTRPIEAPALPAQRTEAVPDMAPPAPEAAAQPLSEQAVAAAIQRHLRDGGFAPGPADGIVGPQTQRAIASYQRAHGLAVDGRSTPALLSRLEREAEGGEVAEAAEDEPAPGLGAFGALLAELTPPQTEAPAGRPQTAPANRPVGGDAAGAQPLSRIEPAAGDPVPTPRAVETQIARLSPPGAFKVRLIEDARMISDLDRAAIGAVKTGALDRAISLYSHAIAAGYMSRATLAAAFNNRGAVYERKGDRNLAAADYNEAIRLDPALDEAFFNRGLLHEANVEQQQAMRDFDQAFTLDPTDREYRAKLVEYGLLRR